MANSANRTSSAERPAPSVPPVESFAGNGEGGEVNITLARQQWLTIAGALSIAAGQMAIERDYDHMFYCTLICSSLARRLGVFNQQAAVGDLPPPANARVATAAAT